MDTLKELLAAKGLYARCPNCEETFPVRKAQLFDATRELPAAAARQLIQARLDIAEEHDRLRQARALLKRRSFTAAATSGVGQALEMVAASLSGLPAAPQDCRAILKPIDYVAFTGASTGKVSFIGFIEVKTGQRGLSSIQRQIKQAVDTGSVKLRVANHRLCLK